MSCGCKIGGAQCQPCRANNARKTELEELRAEVDRLNSCVVYLVESLNQLDENRQYILPSK